uniref:P/Homo B domain-containing protein n=1 Tax=Gasterosteus aculeatus aculeatus TaxID=481459 RepID=A0AAQ4RSI0_GASAC
MTGGGRRLLRVSRESRAAKRKPPPPPPPPRASSAKGQRQPHVEAELIASPFMSVQVFGDYYHFRHHAVEKRSLSGHRGTHIRLEKEPKVQWAEQQVVKKRKKRDIYEDPTDPDFPEQWYLVNRHWRRVFRGRSVVQAARVRVATVQSTPRRRQQRRVCMLDGEVTDVVEAHSLSLNPQHIHIYSASWGPEDDGKSLDGPAKLAKEAFLQGITKAPSNRYTTQGRYSLLTLPYLCSVNLTWRDMQHLVVRTSRPGHLSAGDWKTNGVGRRGTHSYGYGLLDAGAMVTLAQGWNTVAPQHQCVHTMLTQPRDVGSKLVFSKSVDACWGLPEYVRSLEHVQARITLSHNQRGKLAIHLISPLGTCSTLLFPRPNDFSFEGFNDWAFMTTHPWGEDPQGEWTLEIENVAANVVLSQFTLILWGTGSSVVNPSSSDFPRPSNDSCKTFDAQQICIEPLCRSSRGEGVAASTQLPAVVAVLSCAAVLSAFVGVFFLLQMRSGGASLGRRTKLPSGYSEAGVRMGFRFGWGQRRERKARMCYRGIPTVWGDEDTIAFQSESDSEEIDGRGERTAFIKTQSAI